MENRNQQREKERRERKLTNWLNNLNPDQKLLITSVIETQINKIEEFTEKVINECFGTAINERFEELIADEVNKILVRADYFISDYKKALEENGGDFKMINDEKILNEVRTEIKGMIKNKVDKLEGIKILRQKYKIPQNKLVSIWVEVKENRGVKAKKPQSVTKTIVATDQEKEAFFNKVGIEVSEKMKVVKRVEEVKEEINIEQAIAITNEKGFEIADNKKGKFIYVKDVVKELGVEEAEFKIPSTIKKSK